MAMLTAHTRKMQRFAGCQIQWPKGFEDTSVNEEESYTKQLGLSFARRFVLCWKDFFFYATITGDDSQACTDKCSSDLQLLIQQETSYRVACMLVQSLAFLRGLLPCLEHVARLCRRGISLRHLWCPSQPSLQCQMEVIHKQFECQSPPPPPSLGFGSSRCPVGPEERGQCSSPRAHRHACAFQSEPVCFERTPVLLG